MIMSSISQELLGACPACMDRGKTDRLALHILQVPEQSAIRTLPKVRKEGGPCRQCKYSLNQ
eukprot:966040-Pelagomonas_calceolata.AAC.1